MDVNYDSDDEHQWTRDGHGRLLDDLGRVWQEAVWDDDLTAMSPSDVSHGPCIFVLMHHMLHARPPFCQTLFWPAFRGTYLEDHGT